MQNLLCRCLRAPLRRAADAITWARLWLDDLLCEPFPETDADRLRAARLKRLVEEGRALGLLDEGEDEATLAWHQAQRQIRRAITGATATAGDRMGRIALAALVLLASSSAALACGTERWPVKVGTDRDAGRVEQHPQPSTIRDLVSLPAPSDTGARPSSRFAPTELTVFQIHGVLKVINVEKDEDYHMVIADPNNRNVTMIVKAPNPQCVFRSAFETDIAGVRRILDRKFGQFRRLEPNVPVSVTGVAFFDLLHGQEGVAPNGIELHPVLAIVFE